MKAIKIYYTFFECFHLFPDIMNIVLLNVQISFSFLKECWVDSAGSSVTCRAGCSQTCCRFFQELSHLAQILRHDPFVAFANIWKYLNTCLCSGQMKLKYLSNLRGSGNCSRHSFPTILIFLYGRVCQSTHVQVSIRLRSRRMVAHFLSSLSEFSFLQSLVHQFNCIRLHKTF